MMIAPEDYMPFGKSLGRMVIIRNGQMIYRGNEDYRLADASTLQGRVVYVWIEFEHGSRLYYARSASGERRG